MNSSEYFDSLLSGVETESLPIADKKAGQKSFSECSFQLNISKTNIKKICTKYNIDENILFNAAFGIVTARFSCANESLYVLVDEKTVPVYCKFDENTTVSDYLTLLQNQIKKSKEYALPFEEIAKKYNINSDLVLGYEGKGRPPQSLRDSSPSNAEGILGALLRVKSSDLDI